jgi:large subunit ribosomal protein L22
MEYQATTKYIRTSTRKVRLIADAIRGLRADRAIAILAMTPKAAAEPVLKTLMSAIANAKKTAADAHTLVLTKIEVMGGPVMKRFHAVSRGMAHSYKKRMTHLKIVIEEKGDLPAVKAGK